MDVIAGPIPGENFTSDTRNYPWHRPPEYDDLGAAFEYAAKKITNNQTSISMMTLAKSGMPLVAITQAFLMQGISRGKWTTDYALLLAGPITHMLSLMAKSSNISHTLGIEDDGVMYSSGFFDTINELDDEEEIATETMSGLLSSSMGPTDELAEQGLPTTGFAGMAAGDPSMAPEMDPNAMSGDPSVDMPETPDINML